MASQFTDTSNQIEKILNKRYPTDRLGCLLRLQEIDRIIIKDDSQDGHLSAGVRLFKNNLFTQTYVHCKTYFG